MAKENWFRFGIEYKDLLGKQVVEYRKRVHGISERRSKELM